MARRMELQSNEVWSGDVYERLKEPDQSSIGLIYGSDRLVTLPRDLFEATQRLIRHRRINHVGALAVATIDATRSDVYIRHLMASVGGPRYLREPIRLDVALTGVLCAHLGKLADDCFM